jgi:NADPH:quinone reductase-like Zn-dependent oxidoreductase
MKAVIRSGHGSLEVRDVAAPVPQDGEVLVRVRATSVNDFDIFYMHPPLPFRIIGKVMRALSKAPRRMRIAGCDVAGIVESVGPNVTRFRPGDAVFGDLSRTGGGGFGAFAEYVCASEGALLPKPGGITFEQAAALPQAGALAMQGLLAAGPIQPRWKILINGAGGGVGTIGVQVLKLHDVEVTGVDRASKLEMMRGIGFDHVIDYEKEDFTESGNQYDLIVDTKTNRSPFAYARALKPAGTYATVGGENARVFQMFLGGRFLSRTLGKNLKMLVLKPNSHLAYLAERCEAGQIVPVIDGPYMLRDAPQALRYFESGQHKGKVIITID